QSLCNSDGNCKVYTFITDLFNNPAIHNMCHLKSAAGQKNAAARGLVSGLKKPPPPVDYSRLTGTFDIEVDMDYMGDEYKQLANKTIDECQSLCNADGNCNAYTYVSNKFGNTALHNICFMKTGTGQKNAN